MRVRTTLPISEARKKIFAIAKEIQKPGCYYTLTENGRPTVVMLSAEEFDSWLETQQVLREMPGILEEVAQADADVRSGAYKNYSTLEKWLDKHTMRRDTGIISKRRYVSSRNLKTRRKGNGRSPRAVPSARRKRAD